MHLSTEYGVLSSNSGTEAGVNGNRLKQGGDSSIHVQFECVSVCLFVCLFFRSCSGIRLSLRKFGRLGLVVGSVDKYRQGLPLVLTFYL